MFGPGRAFDKCPGRAGRPGSLGVADFTQGRGSRGAGRRPPATLPSLRAATRTLGKRDRGGAWRLAGSGAASGAADRTVRVWARLIDSARATRRVMQPRALGNDAVPFWDSLSQAAGLRFTRMAASRTSMRRPDGRLRSCELPSTRVIRRTRKSAN